MPNMDESVALRREISHPRGHNHYIPRDVEMPTDGENRATLSISAFGHVANTPEGRSPPLGMVTQRNRDPSSKFQKLTAMPDRSRPKRAALFSTLGHFAWATVGDRGKDCRSWIHESPPATIGLYSNTRKPNFFSGAGLRTSIGTRPTAAFIPAFRKFLLATLDLQSGSSQERYHGCAGRIVCDG
jgi:hypothetical protein